MTCTEGHTTVLATDEVSKRFVLRGGRRDRAVSIHAVEKVSIELSSGATLGIVGESGCGKSTLGRLMAGLLAPTEGAVVVDGLRCESPRDSVKKLRGKVQMVFQDPGSALDPRMAIWASVAEPLVGEARSRRRQAAREILAFVGLPRDAEERRPHELSGGEQQRVCIARALVKGERLLVLDEVVSALDPLLQAQILGLLLRIQSELGTSYVFISHDLRAVSAVSSTVAVMYLGEVVELASVAQFERGQLLHPYSVALWSARLTLSKGQPRSTVVLRGDLPSPARRPKGCPFHTRCPAARGLCADVKPELQSVGSGQQVACHYPGEMRAIA